MKTVLINQKEGSGISSQKINVNAIISLNSSFVDVSQHLNEGDKGVFIQLKHKDPVAKLNLTDVAHYALLFFNDALEYKSSAVSIKSGSGSFVVQTQYKNILVLKIPHHLNLHQILSLSIEEDLHANILTVKISDSSQGVQECTLKQFVKGYGEFPYVIMRENSNGSYMQVPIHFNKKYDFENYPGAHIENISDEMLEKYDADKSSELHEKLIEHCKWIKNKVESERNITIELWLVESPNSASYFNGETITNTTKIPTGGKLITQDGKLLAVNFRHYLKK